MSFSVSQLSCTVSLSRLVAEHPSGAVQVSEILSCSFSAEILEEPWAPWKESRRSLTRVCGQGPAFSQPASTSPRVQMRILGCVQ